MARIWKTRKDTRWKPKATITCQWEAHRTQLLGLLINMRKAMWDLCMLCTIYAGNPACSAAASRHVEPHVIAIGGSFGGTATRAAELAHSSHPLSAPAANLNFVSQLFSICHFHHHHQHDQRHNLPPLLCVHSSNRSLLDFGPCAPKVSDHCWSNPRPLLRTGRGSAARSRPTPFTDAIALRVFRPSLLVPGQPGLACAVERTSVAV